ncbi:hypothetical protein [Noviherbaspirillum humi]|uniref:hypothetical protein n=1 Tax=Noviherbaspirillum humi TaxID=1688639 RepID=UPI001160BE18|nr:hypothetical protein [Noviherbaspirillum humi]
MSATVELWTSSARDAFGCRFRDAWHVVGWEEGKPPEGYVCWLPTQHEQRMPAAIKSAAPQLELFE